MRLTLFKLGKPRGFNYKPIYYDPAREEREERRREVLGPDAESTPEGEYKPGDIIRTYGIKRSRTGITSRLADKKRTSTTRAVIALAILAALLVWLLS